jgi:hypothetical protein
MRRAGEVETATCTACGAEFSYVRVGRARTNCDPCRAKRGYLDRRGRRYGISVAEAMALRKAATVCDICGSQTPGRGFTGWHIDHDHETGALRGVLCGACNIGLGHFGDDIARMTLAIEYLRSHART